MIIFIPGVLFPFLGVIIVLAVIFIPSFWIFGKVLNFFGAIFAFIFEGIRDLFSWLFGTWLDKFRYSGPLGKAICVIIALAVIGWIINWLRY